MTDRMLSDDRVTFLAEINVSATNHLEKLEVSELIASHRLLQQRVKELEAELIAAESVSGRWPTH